MTLDLEHLPTDLSVLHTLVRELAGTLTKQDRQIRQLVEQVKLLRHNRFGRSSERDHESQQKLFEELLTAAAEDAAAEEAADEDKAPVTRRNGRKKLPAHLPREIKEHPLPEDQQQCTGCGEALTVIGEETSEQIEYIPASFIVHRHVRYKYACGTCKDRVVTSELPPQPIEKGLAAPGMLSHVITSKYCDHLPLARQEKIYQRNGLDLSRKTLCDWVARCAELLEPVVDWMKKDLFTSGVVRSDDTRMPIHAKGGVKKGYIWTYIGGASPGRAHIVYDFTDGRSRAGPSNFVPEDFEGYFQADAYAGYNELYARETGPTESGCWAHARRKFFNAEKIGSADADEMLALIRRLYVIEREAKEQELRPGEIRRLRQERSLPILTGEIRPWLEAKALVALPESELGKAIRYAMRKWEALLRYTEDGELEIDNNWAERELRRVVLGRKNWLFVGSEEGGKRAAILYSLVASCRHHGIDPFDYFRDVLRRIPTHPMNEIEKLVPAFWTRRISGPVLGNLQTAEA